MEGSQAEPSSVFDARAASVGINVTFSQIYSRPLRQGFSSEKDALRAAPLWEYNDYAKWCAGWFDQQSFAEMALDGSSLEVYDRNHWARHTAVDAYVFCWKACGRTWAGIFLGFMFVVILFARHSDEVEYVRQLSDWLQKSTDTMTLDLSCCCLRMRLDCFYMVQDVKKFERELDLELRQRTIDCGFIVGWHNSNYVLLRLKAIC